MWKILNIKIKQVNTDIDAIVRKHQNKYLAYKN